MRRQTYSEFLKGYVAFLKSYEKYLTRVEKESLYDPYNPVLRRVEYHTVE